MVAKEKGYDESRVEDKVRKAMENILQRSRGASSAKSKVLLSFKDSSVVTLKRS